MSNNSNNHKDGIKVEIPKNTNLNNLQQSTIFGGLKLRTFNQRIEDAKNQPVPKQLFSHFIYENEITVLFAKTNAGKSVLSVQIGDSISKGSPIHSDFKFEGNAQKVLYLDCEMTDKQVEKRVSQDWRNHYSFSEDYLSLTINHEADLPDGISMEDRMLCDIDNAIEMSGAKIIIIDNLTYLGNELEKGKFAARLMKVLKSKKEKKGLTILILAHTPKVPAFTPIDINHLAGSSKLGQFIDSAFFIGISTKDSNLRYLKQVKIRSGEKIYGADNVPVFELNKIVTQGGARNFLAFEFTGRYESEQLHIAPSDSDEKMSKEELVVEYDKEGKSLRWIAKELHISKSSVSRILKRCKEEK
ncbi:MAG: AAA family ATPase [Bacteroidota bacterium]